MRLLVRVPGAGAARGTSWDFAWVRVFWGHIRLQGLLGLCAILANLLHHQTAQREGTASCLCDEVPSCCGMSLVRCKRAEKGLHSPGAEHQLMVLLW